MPFKLNSLLNSARLRVLVRYGMSGAVIFAFNMALASLAFSLDWVEKSYVYTNLANVLTTEATLLFSFLVHNHVTWAGSGEGWTARLFRFHLVAGAGLMVRTALFAILTAWGLTWLAATLLSISVQVVLNFLGFDRVVFSAASAKSSPEKEDS